MAMGCDDGIHIKVSDEEYKKCDAFVISKALSEVIKQKGFGLVFCGKQAIDDDALAIPQNDRGISGLGPRNRCHQS